jgi:nitrite transporter NirC
VPVPINSAVDEQGDLAVTKTAQASRTLRFLFASSLAGVYVGVAVVLLITVSAPLAASGSPATKLVQAAVFGIALTLVVFAGAELFTGSVMVMLQGLARRQVGLRALGLVLGLTLVGNLVGSIVLAAVVHGGGTMSTGPAAEVVRSITAAKAATPGFQLFWRAVLCNMLVCLGLWMANRTKSDAAKLVVLWWALLAFIGSGFEHSIANMAIFATGALQGVSAWSDLATNLAWTVPGNVVGGGIVVGLGYAWLGTERRRAAASPPGAPASPAPLDVAGSPHPVTGPEPTPVPVAAGA